MKFFWSKKYTTISIYSFIVIALSILFFNLIHKINDVGEALNTFMTTMQPFIAGFIMAYLLNFILVFYENGFKSIDKENKLSQKSKRSMGLIATYCTLFTILYLFGKVVMPQLIDSLSGLANDIPTYISTATNKIEELSKTVDINPEYKQIAMDKWNEFVNLTITFVSNLLPALYVGAKAIFSSLWNIVIGLIVSIYLLADKEKFCASTKKITYALFDVKVADYLIKLGKRSDNIFGNFISGKILDSLIIGVLTFFVLAIFEIPYSTLIAVIIGITNIIPFFGPFFGAIPSALIILFVSPVKTIWFLVIIVIIQQIDGNIIGPKILGDSLGISAFWILFALLVAGKLLGLVGMIIGVPLFAILYSTIKELVEIRLEQKNMPIDTNDYM